MLSIRHSNTRNQILTFQFLTELQILLTGHNLVGQNHLSAHH